LERSPAFALLHIILGQEKRHFLSERGNASVKVTVLRDSYRRGPKRRQYKGEGTKGLLLGGQGIGGCIPGRGRALIANDLVIPKNFAADDAKEHVADDIVSLETGTKNSGTKTVCWIRPKPIGFWGA